MTFIPPGLTQQQFMYLESEVIQPLKDKGAVVYLFGSRARGDHRPFSDVDLLVAAEKSNISSLVSTLREKMEESNFPFKVDLVLESQLAVAYRESVVGERIEL